MEYDEWQKIIKETPELELPTTCPNCGKPFISIDTVHKHSEKYTCGCKKGKEIFKKWVEATKKYSDEHTW